MANSVIPAAFRAIVAALTANLPDGTLIIPGPATTHPTDQKYVLVGCDDPDALVTYSRAVSGSQSWAQLGGMKRNEDFTVHCVATAWNGDGDCLAAMDDVFALLAGIESALVTDPTLTGALLYAPGISTLGLKFLQDAQGAAAQLPFDVECKSRI